MQCTACLPCTTLSTCKRRQQHPTRRGLCRNATTHASPVPPFLPRDTDSNAKTNGAKQFKSNRAFGSSPALHLLLPHIHLHFAHKLGRLAGAATQAGGLQLGTRSTGWEVGSGPADGAADTTALRCQRKENQPKGAGGWHGMLGNKLSCPPAHVLCNHLDRGARPGACRQPQRRDRLCQACRLCAPPAQLLAQPCSTAAACQLTTTLLTKMEASQCRDHFGKQKACTPGPTMSTQGRNIRCLHETPWSLQRGTALESTPSKQKQKRT